MRIPYTISEITKSLTYSQEPKPKYTEQTRLSSTTCLEGPNAGDRKEEDGEIADDIEDAA